MEADQKELDELRKQGKDPDLGGETPMRFFPVEIREDGILLQVACYQEKENTLLQVGTWHQ